MKEYIVEDLGQRNDGEFGKRAFFSWAIQWIIQMPYLGGKGNWMLGQRTVLGVGCGLSFTMMFVSWIAEIGSLVSKDLLSLHQVRAWHWYPIATYPHFYGYMDACYARQDSGRKDSKNIHGRYSNPIMASLQEGMHSIIASGGSSNNDSGLGTCNHVMFPGLE